MRYTLPKSSILRGYKAFTRVIDNGVYISSPHIGCHVLKDESAVRGEKVVIGFAVPKRKVLLAVHRNRIKRLLRESVRKHLFTLEQKMQEQKYVMQIIVMYKGSVTSRINTPEQHTLESEWVQIQHQLEKMI